MKVLAMLASAGTLALSLALRRALRGLRPACGDPRSSAPTRCT